MPLALVFAELWHALVDAESVGRRGKADGGRDSGVRGLEKDEKEEDGEAEDEEEEEEGPRVVCA